MKKTFFLPKISVESAEPTECTEPTEPTECIEFSEVSSKFPSGNGKKLTGAHPKMTRPA